MFFGRKVDLSQSTTPQQRQALSMNKPSSKQATSNYNSTVTNSKARLVPQSNKQASFNVKHMQGSTHSQHEKKLNDAHDSYYKAIDHHEGQSKMS